MATKRRFRWWFYLIALLPALTLLAGAEWWLQWKRDQRFQHKIETRPFWRASAVIHRRSRDPELIYELNPDTEATRDGVHIRINHAGFRDDPFPKISADQLRIAVLGDSVAWGWGVPMDRAFPQVLEKQLPRQHPNAVVFNMAVDGYATRQEIRLLESKVPAVKPHIVILNYVLNDPAVHDGGLAWHYQRQSRSELLIAATRFLFYVGNKLRSPEDSIKNPLEFHQAIHHNNRAKTQQYLSRFNQWCEAHGARCYLAITPLFKFSQSEYEWHNIHEDLAVWAKANNITVIDLWAPFAEQGLPASAVSLDTWHPNPKGHRIMARAIAQALQPAIHLSHPKNAP